MFGLKISTLLPVECMHMQPYTHVSSSKFEENVGLVMLSP